LNADRAPQLKASVRPPKFREWKMETRIVKNRSAPAATIVPILIYEDVNQAIEWLCRTFGFTERLRAERDGVTSHAQLTVAEGAIMLGRQGGPYRAPQGTEVTAYVLVAVDQVDEHYQHAKQCGAHIVQPPTDMPFGERVYTAQDHAGHRWTFSQHIADVAPEEWGAKTAGGD
jgi:uncharacterized glyoxalase superfamily protein PhnB